MLYLLPNTLSQEEDALKTLPSGVQEVVCGLQHLIAESEKGGRQFLKRFSFHEPKTFRDITIHLLNEHTTKVQKTDLIHQVKEGGNWGLVSDCGMPCLADPGEDFVHLAHENKIPVEVIMGPSSLFLALILSGLNSQRFNFAGYLPREEPLLKKQIKELEKHSCLHNAVCFFIETPYRNEKLFEQLLSHLDVNTKLCVAVDLTLKTQWVSTKTILQWKKGDKPCLNKRPSVFLLRSDRS